MFYRLIVIKNSLKDRFIIEKYEVLSETTFAKDDSSRKSPMLKIRIPEQEVDSFVEKLKNNIIYPYYAHLYHEDPKMNKLIVVFEEKRINTEKNDYQRAVDYGLQHDVSKEELNISPRDINQEDW